jgi:hypothetical protein
MWNRSQGIKEWGFVENIGGDDFIFIVPTGAGGAYLQDPYREFQHHRV